MTQTQTERSRTFSWTDPAAGTRASSAPQRPGAAAGDVAGELPAPPVMHLIDMAGMEVEEGRVTV